MKKLLFFAALVCCTVMNVFAQLKVHQSGIVIVGNSEHPEEYGQHQMDTVSMLKIYGRGDNNCEGRMTFGDNYYRNATTVAVGEADNWDTNKLWLHGAYGIIGTSGYNPKDTIFSYDLDNGDYFKFGCDVHTSGVFIASDNSFKENVMPLENSLASINGLSGVSYDLKTDESAYTISPELYSILPPESIARLEQTISQNRERTEAEKHRFGFIAQDVKEILPELVHTTGDGYMYVDYIGMIPLLVNAIKELSAELNELKNGTEEEETPTVNYAPATTGNEDLLGNHATEVLSQNDPNPFSSDTRIGYCLPEGTAKVAIYIYDLQGKQVKRLDIDGNATSVTLNGGDLQAGMYIYSLIADGKELASKKMILTK